ncbi:MAG: hypothetical protein AAF721_39265 [Myxococcota bacterium]
MAEDEQPEDALAVVDSAEIAQAGTRSADLYEAQYMQGQGAVLHRAKERAPKLLQLAMVLPALTVLPMVVVGGWVGGLAFGLAAVMSVVMWALFSVLRVTVSEGQVNVQYGLFGPTIPIASIASAEATTYDWKKFGGWGIRRSRDGEWIYNMPGDQGRAVRITWTDDKGKRKVTLVGSKTPDTLAAAIATARGRSLKAGPDNALPPEAS